jgi:hypothetical protein
LYKSNIEQNNNTDVRYQYTGPDITLLQSNQTLTNLQINNWINTLTLLLSQQIFYHWTDIDCGMRWGNDKSIHMDELKQLNEGVGKAGGG